MVLYQLLRDEVIRLREEVGILKQNGPIKRTVTVDVETMTIPQEPPIAMVSKWVLWFPTLCLSNSSIVYLPSLFFLDHVMECYNRPPQHHCHYHRCPALYTCYNGNKIYWVDREWICIGGKWEECCTNQNKESIVLMCIRTFSNHLDSTKSDNTNATVQDWLHTSNISHGVLCRKGTWKQEFYCIFLFWQEVRWIFASPSPY